MKGRDIIALAKAIEANHLEDSPVCVLEYDDQSDSNGQVTIIHNERVIEGATGMFGDSVYEFEAHDFWWTENGWMYEAEVRTSED